MVVLGELLPLEAVRARGGLFGRLATLLSGGLEPARLAGV
jgi:tetrahydromethanopterin S-methyltransferase subunit F